MSEAEQRAAAWWLRLALGDLRVAKAILANPELAPRAAAFSLQQAAEKALKAAIARDGQDPPRIHDLVALARLIRTPVSALPTLEQLAQARDATEGARYPEPGEPEYDDATLALLTDVVDRTVAAARSLLIDDGVQAEALEPA